VKFVVSVVNSQSLEGREGGRGGPPKPCMARGARACGPFFLRREGKAGYNCDSALIACSRAALWAQMVSMVDPSPNFAWGRMTKPRGAWLDVR